MKVQGALTKLSEYRLSVCTRDYTCDIGHCQRLETIFGVEEVGAYITFCITKGITRCYTLFASLLVE